MTTGWPPSMTATTEFVVPRSIPMILLMLLRSPVRLLSVLLHYGILVLGCQVGLVAAECELLVAAASDLSGLEQPLGTGARTAVPNCEIRFTFGSSGNLAQQIQNGAPYDLFLSAAPEYIKDLHTLAVLPYASGRLAIWSKSGYGWKDLRPPEVRHIAIANPTLAPYGEAAKAALESRGLWENVANKSVYAEHL